MVRLITGAGGMMGSHLYDALRDQDCPTNLLQFYLRQKRNHHSRDGDVECIRF